jgi:uncharacterized protein
MTNQTSVTEASRQVVKRLYEMGAAGNVEGFLACLHKDVEIHEPGCLPFGGLYRGIAAVQQLLSKAGQLLDFRILYVEAIVAEGDRVWVTVRTAVAGTGAPVLVAEESIVRDGKIFRLRAFYFDPTIVINAAAAAVK